MKKKLSVGILLSVIVVSLPFGSGKIVRAETPAASTVSFLYFNDGHEINPVVDKLGTGAAWPVSKR